MKIREMGIRKQVLYLVLACSLVTLVIAGGISLIGILNVRSDAVNIGKNIGIDAAEKSSAGLREISIKSLEGLTRERAHRVEAFFSDFMWDVNILSNEMTTILQNPQNYPSRRVNEPSRANDGKVVAQLQYKSGANRSALAEEVGLTANVQDFQVRMYDSDETVGAVYVASVNGFNITADKISARKVDANNNPTPNDYSTRPWYQKAVQENKLIFTDVFVDARGRGFAISCAKPYYNSRGEIAGVVGEGKTLSSINDIVSNSKMGEESIAFVMNNKTGQILFSSNSEGAFATDNDMNLENDPSLFDAEDSILSETAKKMSGGETGMNLVNANGKSYYLAYEPIANTSWSFGIAMPEAEVTKYATQNAQLIETSTGEFVGSLDSSIRWILFAMIAVFVVIMIVAPFVGRKIADIFTSPLEILTDGVKEIASGNLDKQIEVHTGNEIEHLAICFNAMTLELKRYMENLTQVAAEKERAATELNVATNIQQSMLPHDFDFGRKDFELYASMQAAKKVGGDFYDFYLLDDNHLVVTMADVSGKGVPAALFMAISKTILQNFTMTMSAPDDFAAVMTCANNQLCQNNDAMMFVTVFMGMLDLKTGEFIYVNGGHNPPVIYHKNTDQCEYLKVKKNFVLGGMEDINYIQEKVQLGKGDIIYLYTDGVTEALNNDKELYGETRLLDCMNRVDKTIPIDEMLKIIREDVNKHVNGAEQSDDITMLAVRL